MTVGWTHEIAGAHLAHPFADPEWLAAWWAAFGAGELHVARAGDASLALAARRGRLSSLSNYHSPVFGPATEDEDVARELLGAAFARPEPEVFLHALPESLVPVARAAGGRRRLLVEPAHRSPVVDTTGDADAYAKGLGSTLKRRRRKLEREHAVGFRLDDGGDDLDAALAEGFAIEGSGWKTANGTAILSAPETRRFYTELAHAYRARGELVIGTLTVDERAVAWHFTLRRAGRLYMLKTGYLEDAGKLAPGLVLHLLTIERCFADPSIEAYELLGDVERWKLEFANGERAHCRVAAFGRGPSGRLRWAARRHGIPLARRVRDRIRSR